MRQDRERTEIRAYLQGWDRDISLTIGVRGKDGILSVAKSMTMEKIPEGGRFDPTLKITREEGQSLMDELWQVGLRPSEGTGSAGSLAVTERHLADMREISFGLLRKKNLI